MLDHIQNIIDLKPFDKMCHVASFIPVKFKNKQYLIRGWI